MRKYSLERMSSNTDLPCASENNSYQLNGLCELKARTLVWLWKEQAGFGRFGYQHDAFPGGRWWENPRLLCKEHSFLGKVFTEISMMDKSLMINVTSQIVFSASWKK